MSPDVGRSERKPLRPRWFDRTFWKLHRAAEREPLWERFVELLADYQLHAELAQREVPVVILRPTDGATHA